VVELRRYRLHPGTRETLIGVFDRELVETQEATGIEVLAQFRDVDDPDGFVWLRGFADMPSRSAALTAFYGGSAWSGHKDVANATMIAWDDVRLLRPAWPGSGIIADGAPRPPRGASEIPRELIVATIYDLVAPSSEGFREFFRRTLAPLFDASGAAPLAAYETEPTRNDWPRLPVREGEHAFVWLARFDDVQAQARQSELLEESRHWREAARPALERHLRGPAEVWRLVPTARSRRFG
jgi:hypothetical protein